MSRLLPESFPLGTVSLRPLEMEVQESYLDYAMSVIIARALPDVRDGLKPVHRRILYAMWQLGLRHEAKFRKSATVVGEVLGKYHPHGDVAVYDSLVRLAQDFSMRYPLVEGQGNFGSMDGDAAAAMRYTEARLEPLSHDLLKDIEKETVVMVPNYDGATIEPRVLPSAVPQLLLNGTMGIAVGMATNIPPHNLSEVCDAVTMVIDHPDATIEDIMEVLPGPDFPTGGILYHKKEIQQAYATGRGALVIRARADIEEEGGGYVIIVREMPYQVNKAALLEHIAELIGQKKIEGIKDLRDESNKEGVRVVVELKRDAYPKKVLNQLYHHTELQTTFHVNMLALVDGVQPKVLNLKTVIDEYLKHRQYVVRARTQFDLKKTLERVHILEGLVLALESIDEIIRTIKRSDDKEQARLNLMKKFRLSPQQAQAILEMRLQQLANLERLALEEELKEKKALAKELQSILESPKKVLGIIRTELSEVKKRFADERRTEIRSSPPGEFSQEDLIPNEPVVVIITRDGYLKRLPPETFRVQGRGGKGVVGLTTKEEDTVAHCFSATTHANILFFTTRGRIFQLKAYDIPAATRTARGQAIMNFLELNPGEAVSAVLPESGLGKEVRYLIMVTRQGIIKKVDRQAMRNVRRSGLIAITLKQGDELQWVKPSTGGDQILLVSAQGQAIRCKEQDVRAMGRSASGVRGMKLRSKDVMVGMDVLGSADVHANPNVFVITANGFGKCTPLTQYKIQRRGGVGIKTAKITPKTGTIVQAWIFPEKGEKREGDCMIISKGGQVIRLSSSSIAVLGRATQGVRLMRFKEANEKVASVALLA